MRALIVDDEPLARSRLARMLGAIDGVEVVGEASDGEEALAQIGRHAPDVVFLDIHMPGLDGISVATSSDDLPPIVFTTAYDEHALAAFDAAAVDYLLKPIGRVRLEKAVQKVRRLTDRSEAQVAVGELRALLSQRPPSSDVASGRTPRICATVGGTTHLFDATAITRFFASAKYVAFSQAGEEYLVEDSLSDLETRLADHGFFRTHRGELVNLAAIRSLKSDDGGTVVSLSDGQEARVSRRLVADLKRALGIR
ncbi:MAG: response regulator transcription factor [Myxococcales bacterium]|nr:response regulator transcription factor [Myxococcales bacterium]